MIYKLFRAHQVQWFYTVGIGSVDQIPVICVLHTDGSKTLFNWGRVSKGLDAFPLDIGFTLEINVEDIYTSDTLILSYQLV